MKYKKLGKSDLEVSVIGLGTWAIGNEFFGGVDDKQSISAIQAAIDSGISLIDTAPAYGDGHSEEVVGKAIKDRRDKVVIATKCGTHRDGKNFVRDLKPETIRKEINESLQRLNVDVIDLYQIHWPDEDTPLEDSVNELIKLKEEGKFKYLGVSNFKTDLLEEIMDMTDIVSLQPQYSILSRDIEGDILPFCREHGLGVLSYGSLGGGILTGKYTDQPPKLREDDRRSEFYPYFKEPYWGKVVELVELLKDIAANHDRPVPQVALNWSRQQEGITTALVGAKTPEQARQNAASADWDLTEDELNAIDDAYDNIFE